MAERTKKQNLRRRWKKRGTARERVIVSVYLSKEAMQLADDLCRRLATPSRSALFEAAILMLNDLVNSAISRKGPITKTATTATN